MGNKRTGWATPYISRQDKHVVNYRYAQKCDACDYYLSQRACRKVDGSISPEATCNLWEMRGMPTGGIDGEFYKREFNKIKQGG